MAGKKYFLLIGVMILVGSLLVSCTGFQPEPTATNVPTDTALPQPTSTIEVAETEASYDWDLVFISNSIGFGVPELYAQNIEQDTGKTVQVHDYAIGSLNAVDVLHDLQHGPDSVDNNLLRSLREDVKEAEVIVFFADPEGDPSVTSDFDNCIYGRATPPENCGPETYGDYSENLKAIYAEIFTLRDGKPTIIRAIDLYNPMISRFRKNNMEAECTHCQEIFNNIIHEAAAAYNIPTVSLYDAFNGPDHDQDPREKGYIGYDGLHTSLEGQQLIADLLSEAGYDPVSSINADPEGKPGDEPNPIPPLVLGEGFSPGKWSPSGRYYYYHQGVMEGSGLDQTYPTLHFLNTQTGEICTTSQVNAAFERAPFFYPKPPWMRAVWMTVWMEDNRLLYLSPIGELIVITPCNNARENWTDSLPEPVIATTYGVKKDRSKMLLRGKSGTWIFTPSTRQSVKVNVPAPIAGEETLFAWSPWEEKLVSSRLKKRDGWTGVVVENIDPATGQATRITEFPVELHLTGESSHVIVNRHISWAAKDHILLDYVDGHDPQEKLIDLNSQPVEITDVFTELIGIDNLDLWFLMPISDKPRIPFGDTSITGGDAYYLMYAISGLQEGQFYLYSAETGEVKTYPLDPHQLLIFPNGDIAVAEFIASEFPPGAPSYQIVQVGTDRDPYEADFKGQVPGFSSYGKLVMMPDSQQLMVASDQGISLVDLESGETIRFWALQGLEQFNDLSINLSPDGKHLIVHAVDSPIYTGPSSTTAIYWLRLDE